MDTARFLFGGLSAKIAISEHGAKAPVLGGAMAALMTDKVDVVNG